MGTYEKVSIILKPENQRAYIWAPLLKAVNADGWRVKYAERFGIERDEVVTELYIAAVEKLAKLPPDLPVSSTGVILFGWRAFVDKYKRRHVINARSIESLVDSDDHGNNHYDVFGIDDNSCRVAELYELVDAIALKVFDVPNACKIDRNRQIVKMRFVDGVDIGTIVKRFKTSKAAVDKVCKRFRDYCKENYTVFTFKAAFLSE